jgi:hypothetical protein
MAKESRTKLVSYKIYKSIVKAILKIGKSPSYLYQ